MQKLKHSLFLHEGLLLKLVGFSSLLVLATLLTFSLLLGHILKELMEEQIGQRALAISKTISLMPEIITLVEEKDPHARLATLILELQKSIDARFIVIGDHNTTRLTHPTPELIGEKMVGDDNEKALQQGLYYTSKATGSLGPSIRGKSPIFGKNGNIIGVVSVGYLQESVRVIIAQRHQQFLIYLYGAMFLTLCVTFLLSRKIKHSLLGYEPKEISRLFLEKEAILNAVKEAIIATNKKGEITLCNNVAKNDFHWDENTKYPPQGLQKFLLTCKEMKDVIIDINGVDYICNLSPMNHKNKTIGMVASCRKKEEIDALVWELTRVKQYSERLREKKHEFSNLLHLISGHIQIGEYDKAIALIAEDHLPDEKIIEPFQNLIHDPVVASIFIGKYYFAFDKGVKINLDENSSIEAMISPAISKHLLTLLGNIINNAIDAAALSEAKKVTLFATDIGNDLIFEVEDSGLGIDERVCEKIFEKGFSTKGELHSGYGLYFVKSTLELLGGFISFGKGNYGTIVSIHIPKGNPL
ncbi:ATP-binding protein [Sulfurospirillum barnesii]|uniref:histidine kinase n=1 Tax=Sulfurospirillum barnesii (strain ATCC 700032 / DSM 10660 / SES-3) TaxID=760154 RepID=I3XVE7_SULBS|nr:sensor histidine kinase [Sulfurospirillum barnesii]AFL67921.1 signal transduction histidine kinase regulating citrate/malate metabolism [Sulfurospirillum barnesii SES-3]